MKRTVGLQRTAFKRKQPDPSKQVANKKKAVRRANGSGRTSRAGHASVAEQRYMDKVAGIGCICCLHHGFEGTPAQVHHPRIDLFGMGMRASNWDVIPLCPEHHTGKAGVHSMGHDEFAAYHGISEADLLAWVKRITGNTSETQFLPD